MQLIAKLPDGSSIVRVVSGWPENIRSALQALDQLLTVDQGSAVSAENQSGHAEPGLPSQPARTASQPATPAIPTAGPARRAKAEKLRFQHKAALEAKPTKACVICGKDYGPRSPIQKCCSKECVTEKNRRYARQHHAENRTPRRAALGLTKETRHAALGVKPPSRLDLIRAADRKLTGAEPDPVEQMGRVADRERMVRGED